MSEKFSSGTTIPKQTNKHLCSHSEIQILFFQMSQNLLHVDLLRKSLAEISLKKTYIAISKTSKLRSELIHEHVNVPGNYTIQ